MFNSTFDELTSLVENAKSSLDIAAFYFSLLGRDVMPDSDDSARDGERLLQSITETVKRGVKTRITVNADDKLSSSEDLNQLKAAGAEIRSLNFTRLLQAGVLHTKFIIADRTNFYVGSANMDWRALTQVKEVGVTVRNCSILANDLLKIFEVYWILGEGDSQLPHHWPQGLSTSINAEHPVTIRLRNTESQVFLSSSPAAFNPEGRTNDIAALLTVINRADKFINIAVMDYFPTFLFSKKQIFWPLIDDALRRAAIERGVTVRVMASKWSHTRRTIYAYLRSLASLKGMYSRGSIDARLFVVPSTEDQAKIPYARVNHNKYMVTEKDALIGTSNWSADYFVNTAGVSFVSHETNHTCFRDHSLRESLTQMFERDWLSGYTVPV
jgi:phospholipase D3/4